MRKGGRPSYEAYLAMVDRYAAGRASLEDVTGLVTPAVASRIALEEERTARLAQEEREAAAWAAACAARARRRQLRSLAGKAAQVLAAIILGPAAMAGMTRAYGMASQDIARHPSPEPAVTMTTVITGPGTLVIADGHGLRQVRVLSLTERTSGIATQLPVQYTATDGTVHQLSQLFTFVPAG